MKRFVFLGFVLFLGLPVLAANVNNAGNTAVSQMPGSSSPQTTQAVQPETKQDTPEDKAYKAKMIKMEDEIAQKIKQIQAKQKEIDTEVYLAAKPALISEKAILETQLHELEMARDRIQAEESARKMTLDLKSNTSHMP